MSLIKALLQKMNFSTITLLENILMQTFLANNRSNCVYKVWGLMMQILGFDFPLTTNLSSDFRYRGLKFGPYIFISFRGL